MKIVSLLSSLALGLSLVVSINSFAADTAQPQCPAKEVCDHCKSKCAEGTPAEGCPSECQPCKSCAPH